MARNRRRICNRQTAKNKITLIIDCSYLCYSAFFAFGGHNLSHENEPTDVIFGFLSQIFTLANNFKTNQFIFCWDSHKSFRKEIYPEYKMNRKVYLTQNEIEAFKSMRSQMAKLRQKILPKMGFQNIAIMTGLEADDLIAHIVKSYPGMIVVSSDKDLYQLLEYCDIVFKKKSKFHVYTKNDFINQYDIKPNEWIKVKSIAGCSTDNVIGITGVGDKKAILYIKNKITKGKIFDRITSQQGTDIIAINLALVSLPFKQIDLNINMKYTFFHDDFVNIFTKYNFQSFLKKSKLIQLRENFNLS